MVWNDVIIGYKHLNYFVLNDTIYVFLTFKASQTKNTDNNYFDANYKSDSLILISMI